MKQEEKNLLLKDLCARLPYGVKVNFHGNIEILCEAHIYKSTQTIVGESGTLYDIDIPFVKPYLRPLSNMTEGEKEELKYVIESGLQALGSEEMYNVVNAALVAFEIDFYNKHHFDYRGLIEKELALKAPKGMYKNE